MLVRYLCNKSDICRKRLEINYFIIETTETLTKSIHNEQYKMSFIARFHIYHIIHPLHE